MKNYCGQSVTLQYTLGFIQRQCPDLYTMGHYQQYDLEPEYEFPVWAFRSGWTKTHDIIQCAWSRCYLNQEKAYATL